MTTQLRTDANNLAGAISFKGVDNVKVTTAGPELLGTPKAPTPASGANDTQVATTAFVVNTVAAAGGVVPSNSTPSAPTSTGAAGVAIAYARGDHAHPTQNAAMTAYVPNGSIGSTNVQSAISELDAEKFPYTGGTISGATTFSSQSVHNNGIAINQFSGYNSHSINFNAPNMTDAGVIYGTHVPSQWAGLTLQAQGANASYSLRSTGYAYAPLGWQTASDARLKDNVEIIPNALDKLSRIRGCTFTRNDLNDTLCAGVIAQDVQEVLPMGVSVTDHETGYLSVDSLAIVAVLIESIKELKGQFDAYVASHP